jgi:hypothetical protein
VKNKEELEKFKLNSKAIIIEIEMLWVTKVARKKILRSTTLSFLFLCSMLEIIYILLVLLTHPTIDWARGFIYTCYIIYYGEKPMIIGMGIPLFSSPILISSPIILLYCLSFTEEKFEKNMVLTGKICNVQLKLKKSILKFSSSPYIDSLSFICAFFGRELFESIYFYGTIFPEFSSKYEIVFFNFPLNLYFTIILMLSFFLMVELIIYTIIKLIIFIMFFREFIPNFSVDTLEFWIGKDIGGLSILCENFLKVFRCHLMLILSGVFILYTLPVLPYLGYLVIFLSFSFISYIVTVYFLHIAVRKIKFSLLRNVIKTYNNKKFLKLFYTFLVNQINEWPINPRTILEPLMGIIISIIYHLLLSYFSSFFYL